MQKEWLARLLDEDAREDGVFILSEVAPVITFGKRASCKDLLLSESEFEKRGIELYETSRGGMATYHGPGQWVLFPVARLQRLTGNSRGVRHAVDSLLEIALRVAKKYRPDARIHTGDQLGVWTRRGRKLASIGIQVSRGVLLHGLSLNVFRTPESFFGIRPCGLDAQVDFLLESSSETSLEMPSPERQSQNLITFEKVGRELLETASSVFSGSHPSPLEIPSPPAPARSIEFSLPQ